MLPPDTSAALGGPAAGPPRAAAITIARTLMAACGAAPAPSGAARAASWRHHRMAPGMR